MDWESQNPQSMWPARAASGTQISTRPVLQRKSPNSIRGVSITTRRRYTVAMTPRPQLRQTLITINAEVIRPAPPLHARRACNGDAKRNENAVCPSETIRFFACLSHADGNLGIYGAFLSRSNGYRDEHVETDGYVEGDEHAKRDQHVESWWRHPSRAF